MVNVRKKKLREHIIYNTKHVWYALKQFVLYYNALKLFCCKSKLKYLFFIVKQMDEILKEILCFSIEKTHIHYLVRRHIQLVNFKYIFVNNLPLVATKYEKNNFR